MKYPEARDKAKALGATWRAVTVENEEIFEVHFFNASDKEVFFFNGITGVGYPHSPPRPWSPGYLANMVRYEL